MAGYHPPPAAGARATKKSAIVALALSFFLPGLGHVYAGSVGVGLLVLGLWLLSLLLIFVLIGLLLAPVVWLFGMAHSAVVAERRNARNGYG